MNVHSQIEAGLRRNAWRPHPGSAGRMTVRLALFLCGEFWFAGGCSALNPQAPQTVPSGGEGATIMGPGASSGPISGGHTLDEISALITGNNTPEARQFGAAQLLAAGRKDAIQRLAAILSADPPDLAAQTAVCAAIADVNQPPIELMEPLLNMLGDPRAGLADALPKAIRRFDSRIVVGRIGQIAADPSQTQSRRLVAIQSLGTLGNDFSAMDLLARFLEDKDRAIQRAALSAFTQATGVSGLDAAAAAAWWKRTAALSRLDRLEAINASRFEQVQSLQDEKAELTRRLVAAYREAYLGSNEANRAKYLQGFLGDRLATVRLLGLELINTLITDRQEISQETKAKVSELVADADTRVRLRAAKMVGDLRLAGGLTMLLEALSREADGEVRAAQVNALGRLDDVSVVPVLTDRLDDEVSAVVGEAAAALGHLARSDRNGPALRDKISRSLVERLGSVAADDIDLRVRFLLAMTGIGGEMFRPFFLTEMGPDRPLRVRRAAVSCLASYADQQAANSIRPLLSSAEAELRLSAVEAMATCGRSREDLSLLAGHLEAGREPDSTIRARAWESYLAIAAQLPPDDRIRISDEFNKPGDKASQRQRMEILRALRTDPIAFEQLTREGRIDVLERMADAQLTQPDYAAAAASLEQALPMIGEQDAQRYATFAARLIAALLQGRQDAAAIERVGELTDGQQINGELPNPEELGVVFRKEIESRIAAASEAATFSDALSLIAQASQFSGEFGKPFADDLDRLKAEALAKRDREIARLVDALGGDAAAETNLLNHGRAAVLPRLLAELESEIASASPNHEREAIMLRLVKRLAPEWEGYEPDAGRDQKISALARLRASWEAPKPAVSASADPM